MIVNISICCHSLCSNMEIMAQGCNFTDRTGPQWPMLLIKLDPLLLGYIEHVLCGILTHNDIDLNQVSYNIESYQYEI